MHMARDILNFGVPMEFDTGANESGHKDTKKAALLTQKNQETFTKQTADRLDEMDMLSYAEEELQGNCLWNYGYETREKVYLDNSVATSRLLGQ